MTGSGEAEVWAGYMTREALKTFYSFNQFIRPEPVAIGILRQIYRLLINELGSSDAAVDVSQRHYGRLKQWLAGVDPLMPDIYKGAAEFAEPVTCAFYRPAFQLALYGIDAGSIKGPVLDVGCGAEGQLPRYLRSCGIEAHGFDRLIAVPEPWLQESDWFSFDFVPASWQFIFANQSFSLHFNHFHQRAAGEGALSYARLFMKILHSLKPGGRFVYAPALPFIESALSAGQFMVSHREAFDRFKVTTITRL